MYTKLLLFTFCLIFITQTTAHNHTAAICAARSIPCDQICSLDNITAVCSCNAGWYLHSNGYECVECIPGTWGHGCLQSCTCNQGNGCNKVNGTCICNSCWTGDMCLSPVSSQCFRDFLATPDKSLDNFGGQVPVPDASYPILEVLKEFFSQEEGDTLLSADYKTIPDRPDQIRELLRVTVRLDTLNFLSLSQETTETARGIVKSGDWRCTLIVPADDTWVINI